MTDGPDPAIWSGDSGNRQEGPHETSPELGEGWSTAPGSGEPQAYYGQPGPQSPGYGVPGYGHGAPAYGAAPTGRPPTYLLWARIAAGGGVLFSLILGLPAALVAIRHARKVRSHWETGNPQAALSESRKARTWAIVATVLDVLGLILVIVLIGGQASTSNFSTPSVVAASIKTQLQKRISDPSSQYYQPGLKVTSVVCTSTGAHTDLCVDHFSNGQTVSENAVISANGDSYQAN